MTNKNINRKRSLWEIVKFKREHKRRKRNCEQIKMNLMHFTEITPREDFDLPYPRSGHRAIATDSDFWIWGGFHPTAADNDQPKMFNEVELFNNNSRIYR